MKKNLPHLPLAVQKHGLMLVVFLITILFVDGQLITRQSMNDNTFRTRGYKRVSIGDPAPPLNLHSFIKGKPVTEFKKGKIYLIDFNNTGCIPCHHTISQLRKVADKFSDQVQIISVYNHEYKRPFDEHYKNVKKRVEILGDQLNFSVAIDVPERTTEKNWEGKRTNYVIVNGEGKVAIIGNSHNGQEIENNLLDVIAGKSLASQYIIQEKLRDVCFDLKMAIQEYDRKTSGVEKVSDYDRKRYMDSTLAALKKINELTGKFPHENDLYRLKLDLLTNIEDAAALNTFLSSLASENFKQDYFEWVDIVEGIQKIKKAKPALFKKLKMDALITILDKAINNDPLVTTLPGYLKEKVSLYLLSGRYEDAAALLDDAAMQAKEVPASLTLQHLDTYKLITEYLLQEKKLGKLKSDQWLKTKVAEQNIDVTDANDVVLQSLGKNEMSLRLINAFSGNVIDKSVEKQE